MFTVPILFGVACGIVCFVASFDRDASFLARALTFVWAAANVAWLLDKLEFIALLDWYLGMFALVFWHARNEKWLRVFLQLIFLRLVLHTVDYLSNHAAQIVYLHLLNATFMALLFTVAYPGGRDAGDYLSRRFYRRGARRREGAATPKVKS